ncbi:MAG: ATP-dependent helicase [Chloroflexi bacterium HGW-Chloroflexi-1]|nr:MAG: ATP-dependent helicase [Chloroflexi bacterium HGW-Chloroflexi-1]
MWVLHSHWQPPESPADPGGVLFWAETTDAPQPMAKRGRRAAKPRPAAHPFCASADVVRGILAALGYRSGDTPAQAILALPATRYGPQPSPQLYHDWSLDDPGELFLAPWQIEGLYLPIADAFPVLAHLPSPADAPSGLAIGTDSRYWYPVASLVLEALAGQKLIPVLVQADPKGKTYHARWLAVLDGAQDAPRLAHLEAAMPPLCRAMAARDGAHPSPRALLGSFIKTAADALARGWAAAQAPVFARGEDGVPQRWLRALFGRDPVVAATSDQLKALDRSIAAWLRNLQVAGAGDFRVAFRLAPPEPGGDDNATHWGLHYLLQARHDPSLLVPAKEIWETRGDVLRSLGRGVDRPQERLLAALGYAGRLFEPIRQSLHAARPEQIDLSSDEAFGFLRDSAPLLEQSGFGVLVPPWWNQRGARLGMRLRVKPKSKAAEASVAAGRLSFDQLVAYRWEISVGDTTLTQEEFAALVAMKTPLVQIRGQWVQLDPAQVEAALRFWKSQEQAGDVSLLAALQMGLGAEEAVAGLPVDDVVFEDWLDDWLHQVTGREQLAELPQPAGLHGQLRPYQRYGFSWLAFLRRYGLGACLADDMGLGKTIETIALLLRDKEQAVADKPVLLICPTSVVGNWRREIDRFAPVLSVHTHQGNSRLHGDDFGAEAARNDVVITSYALARRDAETLNTVPWRGVVLDEAQNIKNPAAKQTQAIRKLPADFRIALTGTPVENRLSELWSIMHFLNPGYLGSREKFRKNFAIPVERYGDAAAAGRLKTLIGPFILRRVKSDPRVIQDLPDKLEMKVYCNLTEEQASLYEATVHDALAQVESAEGLDRRGQILAMLMKLKQVCNHPAQFLHQAGALRDAGVGGSHPSGSDPGSGGQGLSTQQWAGRSGKLDRLTEMLEEVIAAGDQALIFSQFAEMGGVLQSYLQGALNRPVLFLHGGTPAAKRDQMVARFQSTDGPPIFVLSLKAGGTGLNLMRANHVFHFDRWWNPAVEDQATDRAFRIGQTRNVQVHKFVTLGTLEEMIDDMIESKRALAQAVVGSGENWLTDLSTDDLRQLVTLRREHVA